MGGAHVPDCGQYRDTHPEQAKPCLGGGYTPLSCSPHVQPWSVKTFSYPTANCSNAFIGAFNMWPHLIEVNSAFQQWKLLLLPPLLGYLCLVSFLRHRRARDLQKRFSPAGRASFARMTTDDAQAVLKDLTELEFPKFFGFSIIFALFKVRATTLVVQLRLTYTNADLWYPKRIIPASRDWSARRH